MDSSKYTTPYIDCVYIACLETLEPRVLMSGNVLVSVSRGNLNIRGDAAGNNIVINQDGLEDDQYRITGQDGTTINGQDEIIIDGVKRSIIANMKGGNDQLTFDNIEALGSISIKGGNGDDTLTVNGGNVGKNIKFYGGQGDNSTTIDGVDIGGKIAITGHNGYDSLSVDNSTVDKKVAFKPKSGNAECTIENSTIGGVALAGRGENLIFGMNECESHGRTRINWGRGSADIDISDSNFRGTTRIDTGNEADSVQIKDSKFYRNAAISTRSGDDNVRTDGVSVHVKTVTIEHPGDIVLWIWPLPEGYHDRPWVEYIYQLKASLNINTGQGDDTVYSYITGGKVNFNGSSGDDSVQIAKSELLIAAVGGTQSGPRRKVKHINFEHEETIRIEPTPFYIIPDPL